MSFRNRMYFILARSRRHIGVSYFKYVIMNKDWRKSSNSSSVCVCECTYACVHACENVCVGVRVCMLARPSVRFEY